MKKNAKRIEWLKAYPGLTLNQKIETREIMWTSHLMADLHYSLERIHQLDSKNYLGNLKQTMRRLYKQTGFARFNPKLIAR